MKGQMPFANDAFRAECSFMPRGWKSGVSDKIGIGNAEPVAIFRGNPRRIHMIHRDDETVTKKKPKSLRRNLIEWLITLAFSVAILYLFAPPSWFQFGPLRPEDRKPTQDFALRKLDGGAWNFGDRRGKVLVVNYWATWCGPCRFETPGLVNAANELTPRGAVFVGVSVDEDPELIAPFVEKYKIAYEILRPASDPNVDADMVLPTTFLYDKKGQLAKEYTGIVLESTIKSDVEKLLNE
jgi:thiol-disulfide isomerase/thioredoxin